MPRTQKGRGVAAMYCYPPWHQCVPQPLFVQSEEDLLSVPVDYFVRPAPPTPEHGYQDSRVAGTKEEIRKMLQETLAVFPLSELIVMPLVNAEASFVWTPGRVVYGKGNAGVTGGGEVLFEMPLVPVGIPRDVLDAAGIPETVTPYIEGLINWLQTKLVQLRYGPEPPKAFDYIPRTVKVERVIKAEGDLIEWGKVVSSLREGDVVEHVGGTLVSHFGVRCMAAKVPIFTTRVPEVGETLQPTQEKEEKIDVAAVQKWMLYGMRGASSRSWTEEVRSELCAAALFVLHNVSAIAPRHPEIVGAAFAVLVKLGVAACLGEARYYSGAEWHHGASRGTVYSLALRQFHAMREKLDAAQVLFESGGHGSGSGVGGYPWAKCTSTVIELEWAMRKLVEEASEERFQQVVIAANQMVNEAHNGGWWLNKFCREEIFTWCSTGDPLAVGAAFKGLMGMLNMPQMSTPQVIGRVVGKQKKDWLEARELEVRRVRYCPNEQHAVFLDLAGKQLMIFTGRVQFVGPMPEKVWEAAMRLPRVGMLKLIPSSVTGLTGSYYFTHQRDAYDRLLIGEEFELDYSQFVCMTKRSMPMGVVWVEDYTCECGRWNQTKEKKLFLCQCDCKTVMVVDAQGNCWQHSQDSEFVERYRDGGRKCMCGGEVKYERAGFPTVCAPCMMRLTAIEALKLRTSREDEACKFGATGVSFVICGHHHCGFPTPTGMRSEDILLVSQYKCSYSSSHRDGGKMAPMNVSLPGLATLGMPDHE